MVVLKIAGEELISTGNHPFWVCRGQELDDRPAPGEIPSDESNKSSLIEGRWVEAWHLREGDIILSKEANEVVVESVVLDPRHNDVYNIEVEFAHNYAVGVSGLLVHNKSSPVGPSTPSSEANKIANGHAYDKHVVKQGEFPEISSPDEFASLVDHVMISNKPKRLSGGRKAWWDADQNMVVIYDPKHPDLGTAFRPTDGKNYYDRLR